MTSAGEDSSVEEQIFEAFFRRLDEDSGLVSSLPEAIRKLYESGELADSSAVAQAIRESSEEGGEADAT